MIMKIHAIKTGDVLVKSAFLGTPAKAGLLPYFANVHLDRTRVRIPVLAWVIEHPDGIIVVDTGEDPAIKSNFITQSRFEIAPEEGIGAQLTRLGIAKKDVTKVVMTHLHGDHMDGLKDFQNTPIWIKQGEFNLATAANGKFFNRLGLQAPTLFNLNADKFGTFENSVPLTSDGTVIAVSTPGHTAEHLSVVVIDNGIHYFIAGDTSYNQQAMLDQKLQGPTMKVDLHRQTLRHILDYTQQYPTVYLPSHDPDGPRRLAANETVKTFA
jgi:glyoxylase-like metal-dependent hydrolase (beta-lactamase superfamily II)